MAFLQVAVGSAPGSANDTATLTGVSAGSTLVAFCFDGDSLNAPTGVSDAQGAYAAQGSAIFGFDSVTSQMFILVNANAGTHAATVTTLGVSAFIVLVELSAPTSGSISGINGQTQGSPGTGTDTITSGSVTVSASATLIAMSADTSTVNVIDEPAAGTGFTSRSSGSNGSIGSWRVESKSVSANAAATFTAILGLDNYATLAAAILEPASDTLFAQAIT